MEIAQGRRSHLSPGRAVRCSQLLGVRGCLAFAVSLCSRLPGVRGAGSGRDRPMIRLKAFAGLFAVAGCSRGCFGKRPARDTT